GLRIQQEESLTPKAIEIIPAGAANTTTTITSAQTSNITVTLPDYDGQGAIVPAVGVVKSDGTDFLTESPLTLSSGGTSHTTQDEAFDTLAPTTTKGDIITHNGSANIRLPVGATNGHVLMANSAQTSGLEWTMPTPFTGVIPVANGGTGVSGTA